MCMLAVSQLNRFRMIRKLLAVIEAIPRTTPMQFLFMFSPSLVGPVNMPLLMGELFSCQSPPPSTQQPQFCLSNSICFPATILSRSRVYRPQSPSGGSTQKSLQLGTHVTQTLVESMSHHILLHLAFCTILC